MELPLNYTVIRRIQTMAKAISEKSKDTKPKRKTKLERTTEAQLFLEQDELQKQLEAEDINTDTPECKSTEAHEQRTIMHEQRTIVHEQPIIRRLRKL